MNKSKHIFLHLHIKYLPLLGCFFKDSHIALSSLRLVVTLMVLLAAAKYGLATCFPPSNRVGLVCCEHTVVAPLEGIVGAQGPG